VGTTFQIFNKSRNSVVAFFFLTVESSRKKESSSWLLCESKKGKNIQKPKSAKLLTLIDTLLEENKEALSLMLASIIKDMYFFWHMLQTFMGVKQSLCRNNPAALACPSITLKTKVHDAPLQTNRNWGGKKLKKEKWTNQHYSIYFNLPALQDKKTTKAHQFRQIWYKQNN